MNNTNKEKKITFGQFFTKKDIWLKPQVKDFILNSGCSIAYDPFAGGGDLLSVAKDSLGFNKIVGLDIDKTLQWDYNDSLLNIPYIENSIIITNPPYIAKQSASRKHINLEKYFSQTDYDDVYLIALDKMLEFQKYVVAIIPESFINSSYRLKNRLCSITVLEDNPFNDTENPVCVVCFDKVEKDFSKIKVYKNDHYIASLEEILSIRIRPKNSIKIKFNTLDGWLGLRAIDSTNDKKKILFDFKQNIKYDWINRIKVSSRHFSLIDIDVPCDYREEFIKNCNDILNEIRRKSFDILLTPFMGNTKNGVRRRRLDFSLARSIMENSLQKIIEEKKYE